MNQPIQQPQQTFCLLAFRPDGSREVIKGGLLLNEATDIFMKLMDSQEAAACGVEQEQK